MTRLYKVTGNIRGECGHNHRSVRRAAICRNRDFVGCARQGGVFGSFKIRSVRGRRNRRAHRRGIGAI